MFSSYLYFLLLPVQIPRPCLICFPLLISSPPILSAGGRSFCFSFLLGPPAVGLSVSVSLGLSLSLCRDFAPVSLCFPAPGFEFSLFSSLRTAFSFSMCVFAKLPPTHKALVPVSAGFKRTVVAKQLLPARRTANGYDVWRPQGRFLNDNL